MWKKDQEVFTERFKKRIHDNTTPTIHFDSVKNLLGIDGTYADNQKKYIDNANKAHESVMELHDEINHMIASSIEYTAKQPSALSQSLDLVVELDDQKQIKRISRIVDA